MQDAYAADLAFSDTARQAAAHYLDLRKLGHRSRTGVLSQAGATLAWTSERADTLFVCGRGRKAAGHERQPQRAERDM